MHFYWKKILQTSKNARTMSTWNSSIRIWRFHRHGTGSIPGMGIPRAKFFDERTAESSQKPLNLRSKFLSLINSGLPHIITVTIIWFFFFILTIVWSTDNVITLQKRHWITFFGINFRTINSDTDPLLLKTDLKTIEEHSKNVNLKLNEIKCNVLRVTLRHHIVIYP